MSRRNIHLNGISYRWPVQPVVVVCIDGGDPAYIEQGIRDGIIPNIARFTREGFSAIAEGTVPSFTCPNNMSLITGAPPAVHGISGNFYLDVASGEAVVMTGPELLRSRTILAEFADAGARVVSITAKDKLRRQLGKDLDLARGNISFSSEMADQCSMSENGIENVLELVGMPLPDIYSMELSLFVLKAGIRLLERRCPALIFLSLTDYIQHKHAPGEPMANEFYRRIDEAFGRLAELGALVALTADHGMNDKSTPAGRPNVIYLQDILDEEFGKGDTRVICPITDAFVKHHGALGGFVRVWCLGGKATPAAIIDLIKGMPGIAAALDKATVCRQFDLPPDREGDVAVLAEANVVIGAAASEHDLSSLGNARLRSHGAPTEARVPFILSQPLNDSYRQRAASGPLKSHQIFDYAINGVEVGR
ncbi:MAG: phosphonoacetate hydrolase [Candidatus Accumulibacter phosphatis]|jgi:phosphonoacetate hydrolase|uniref:phosphonoacetate hydrolase n=1 Tax=Candidatus Accumulibacter phosphatis TaxID=327160 RepID=UPI001A589782|nr:phosphonoacetate hydrolase [Candidatus Accumulibacter phosphatis]